MTETNALDTSYNGWANYATWNVALWITNDEGLYNLACQAGDYQTFVEEVGVGYSTPDGVKFADPVIDADRINELVFSEF
jgi:hypothetical protein